MTSKPMQAVGKTGMHESATLISSAKVQGSHVYRLNGQKIGRIEHMMIDKISGRIAYAVMSAGGGIDVGQNFYPLPWSLLAYNERLGGYEFDVSEDHLKDAPKFSTPESWDWTDQTRGRRIHDYWRALPYWGF